MRGRSVRPSVSGATMTAAACVAASLALCLALARKAIWPAPAASSEPTWRITVPGSPATRPPRRDAISPSVSGPGMGSRRGRLGSCQRLDHLLGDVDARARENGVLEDDVVLLLLGDLADHAVRLLHHLGELLVAPRVEVLAELALLSLEVAVELAEVALLRAALRIAHRDGVLLEVFLQPLQLARHLGELLIALLELGLDLLLRALRRRRLAQDALGVDEAELARRGRGLRVSGRGAGKRRGKHEGLQLHRPLQASESGAESELYPLLNVAFARVQGHGERDLQRPERRQPAQADAGGEAQLVRVDLLGVAVHLAAVDEAGQAQRLFLVRAGDGKQVLGADDQLGGAAHGVAEHVLRPE